MIVWISYLAKSGRCPTDHGGLPPFVTHEQFTYIKHFKKKKFKKKNDIALS